MHHQRIVTCALLLLLTAACEKKKPQADSVTTGTKSAADSALAMAANPTAAAAGAPALCTIDHATTKCKNVLPTNWETLDAAEQYDLLSALEWNKSDSKGVKRKYKAATCSQRAPDQVLRAPVPAIAMDARTGVKWKAGAIVAMAQFVPQGKNQCPDDIYSVGSILPDRKFYLLFTVAETFSETPSGDTVIGSWKLVSYNSTTPQGSRVEVRSGRYIRCGHQHSVAFVRAISDFQTCVVKKQLLDVAQQFNVTNEEVLASYDSLRSGGADSTSYMTQNKAGRAPYVSALVKILNLDDPSTDPAWTTCALGCCVAEGLQPTSPPKVTLLRNGSLPAVPNWYGFAFAIGSMSD